MPAPENEPPIRRDAGRRQRAAARAERVKTEAAKAISSKIPTAFIAAIFSSFIASSIGQAAPGSITVYPIPGKAATFPNQITMGPDQRLWFTQTNTNAISRFDVDAPRRFTTFELPSTSEAPFYIVPAPDKNLWFATGGSVRYLIGGTRGAIGRILTRSPNTVTEYPLPRPTDAGGIVVVGPDGKLWFEYNPGQGAPAGSISHIGRMDPREPGKMQEFDLPKSLTITAMVPGPKNEIFFGGYLGKYSFAPGGPHSLGVVGHFPVSNPRTIVYHLLPGQGAYPYGGVFSIIVGPDGNLWLSQASSVIRVTPDDPPKFYAFPVNVLQVIGLVTGPDGNIWFAQANNGVSALNRLSPKPPYRVTQYNIPGDPKLYGPQRIVVGPDKNLWATVAGETETTAGEIAKLKLAP